MEENHKSKKIFYWTGLGVAFWLTCEWRYRYLRDSIRDATVEPLTILEGNEGKPIILKGILKGNGVIEDKLFNIKKECLKLLKTVKRYENEWKEDYSDSPEFLVSQEIYNEDHFEIYPYKISQHYLKNFPHTFKISPISLTVTQQKWFATKGYAVYKDEANYYVSKYRRKSNIYKPTKGDFQVKFDCIPNKTFITIFGKQTGNTISPFDHPDLTHPVLIIQPGWHSIDEIINTLPIQNSSLLIMSRIIGPLSILFSFYYHLTNKA